MLKINDKAPDFNLVTDKNEEITLANFRGCNLILYFYPKDNTPGCTREAKDFSNLIEEFKENNAVIVGISKDNSESHRKFIAKHNLLITLASYAEQEILEKYEVLVEKSMFGKKYQGVERATFLINKVGFIKKTWYKVKISGHAKEVLSATKEC